MEQNMKKSAVKEKLSMIDEPLFVALPYLLLYMLHFISIRD